MDFQKVFSSIYLDNSTYNVQLILNCAFGNNKVSCLITPDDISGDPDIKIINFILS
jgi:hypothetical protein